MCGIIGYSKKRYLKTINSQFLQFGVNLLKHRGPDDFGIFETVDKSVGLAHTRLSILDLSYLAHQPMIDISKRFFISYNGEVYNFKELRKELEKEYSFSSTSDTEVILYSYIHYGINFLQKLNGIFALAIYDKQEDILLIARDRFGTKPLYYTCTDSGFYFASEIKALMTLDDLDLTFDFRGLENCITYLWNPGPQTILQSIKKVEPGYYILLKKGEIKEKNVFYKGTYEENSDISFHDYVQEIDRKLQQAVLRQTVSDVPIGAFLSGGLDSSAVVSYVKNFSNVDIPTFTIKVNNDLGMANDYYYANRVANHLNVKIHPIEVDHNIFFNLEEMIYFLDEPQADLAPILVSYISQKAKEEHGIKVLLSGVGGDDIFSGYRRHYAISIDRYLQKVPLGLRESMKKVIQNIPIKNSSFLRRLKKYIKNFDLVGQNRIVSYFSWLDRDKRRALFSEKVRNYLERDSYESEEPLLNKLLELPVNTSPLNQMLHLEMNFFLPDHNLNYTDKMGMKEGVEIRVPLLDNDLVDFISTVPIKYKQYGNEGKYIFKKVMEKYLPKDVIYRPKTGFGTPLKSWIHNELEGYITSILSRQNIEKRGIFEYDKFQEMLLEDKLGIEDHSYNILSVLIIELWCKIFIDERQNFKKVLV